MLMWRKVDVSARTLDMYDMIESGGNRFEMVVCRILGGYWEEATAMA